MDDLAELYQELIIDHNRHPRNFTILAKASHTAEGFNPLCGDSLTIYLLIQNDKIIDARFQGQGCAICMASASMLTEILHHKYITTAKVIFQQFLDSVTLESTSATSELGKLTVLRGVKAFPSRVKCATLAIHTANAALDNRTDLVSTE